VDLKKFFAVFAAAIIFLFSAAEAAPNEAEKKIEAAPGEAEKKTDAAQLAQKRPKRPRHPKWEIGAAGGAFYLPDYPGSDVSRSRSLLLPYGVYRGDILRADQDGGIRGRFCNTERVECDLSFGAGFRSRSADNEARQDMENIDWIGEVGPRVQIHISKDGPSSWTLRLPVRYVFSTEIFKSLDFRGYVFDPRLSYSRGGFLRQDMFLSISGGPGWATERLHDYFYEVDQQYVTANRRLYNASGGFFGWESSISIGRQISPQITLVGGMSKSFYADAKNRSSPLHSDIETQSYFLVLAWSLYSGGVAPESMKVEHVIEQVESTGD